MLFFTNSSGLHLQLPMFTRWVLQYLSQSNASVLLTNKITASAYSASQANTIELLLQESMFPKFSFSFKKLKYSKNYSGAGGKRQGTKVWLGCVCRRGVEQFFSFYKRPPVSISESGCHILSPSLGDKSRGAFSVEGTSLKRLRGSKGKFKGNHHLQIIKIWRILCTFIAQYG